MGTKVISVRPSNAAAGAPTLPSAILLIDEATGLPTALVDGTELTGGEPFLWAPHARCWAPLVRAAAGARH